MHFFPVELKPDVLFTYTHKRGAIVEVVPRRVLKKAL